MNKTASLVLLAGLSLGTSAPASAAFIGAYDVANWTIATSRNSMVNTSGAPDSITLTSGDDGSGLLSNADFTITAAATGTISFDWLYRSFDSGGSPAFDPFGYLLNGVFHTIVNTGPNPQSGSTSFLVNAGDVFGFRAHSIDSQYGAARIWISNFNAPAAANVPEPEILALLGLGWAVAIGPRRRKI